MQPLYQQIKHYIKDNIQSGRWPVGYKITTEIELASQFKVSRMTANKAIMTLVAEGLLQRKPRSGTIVCQPTEKAESPLVDIRNIADEVNNRGQSYKCKVIRLSNITADEEVAKCLGVMYGFTVYCSEIIHFSDEQPIQIELRWVNPQYVPNYLEQDFTEFTPNQYLSRCCPLKAIEHSVEAIMPDKRIIKLLSMAPNEPCLLLNRRTWSGEKLISFALLYHPASKYKLTSKIIY